MHTFHDPGTCSRGYLLYATNRTLTFVRQDSVPFLACGQIREKTSGVALIGNSRGEIQLWHVPSAKVHMCSSQ